MKGWTGRILGWRHIVITVSAGVWVGKTKSMSKLMQKLGLATRTIINATESFRWIVRRDAVK